MTGALPAVAVADVRERTRRTSYVVILLAAVAMAFAVLPDPASGWQVVQIGDFAGRYTSAYVATTTAIAGAEWLRLAGFYVVRGSVARDSSSRVGQVLAATPVRTSSYLLGKAVSNLLVLAAMTCMARGTALVRARPSSPACTPPCPERRTERAECRHGRGEGCALGCGERGQGVREDLRPGVLDLGHALHGAQGRM